MELVPVKSSVIKAVGFKNNALHVQMLYNGKTYVYANVPEAIYNAFLVAPSKGKFYNQQVKPIYILIRMY